MYSYLVSRIKGDKNCEKRHKERRRMCRILHNSLKIVEVKYRELR